MIVTIFIITMCFYENFDYDNVMVDWCQVTVLFSSNCFLGAQSIRLTAMVNK